MKNKISDVMSQNPVMLQSTDTVAHAAQAMKSNDVGDVIVLEGDNICGVVTDRDIVLRSVAENHNASNEQLDDICSHQVTTLRATDTVDDAIRIMRQKAIRRVPVIEGSHPIGIVSLGDLAIEFG